jgi:DNA processing protein
MRNAIMSGYGLATVVVEAGEHSGARIQARLAVEHGRPVILSDLVVRQNEWAQRLRSRPGVHVAGGREEVISIVRQLIKNRDEVEDMFRDLLDA